MHTKLGGVAIALFAATACARRAAVQSGGEVAPQTASATASTVPNGSTFNVRLNDSLGTANSKVGDPFSATVTTPITTSSGTVVVPQGAVVHGHVTALHASQHVGDQAVIRLAFDSLSINGNDYPFSANITQAKATTQGETTNQTLEKAGIGAAAGVALGAILSGADLAKMALGGLLGAAAGTAISLGAGETQAMLPAGTQMTLQSTEAVSLR